MALSDWLNLGETSVLTLADEGGVLNGSGREPSGIEGIRGYLLGRGGVNFHTQGEDGLVDFDSLGELDMPIEGNKIPEVYCTANASFCKDLLEIYAQEGYPAMVLEMGDEFRGAVGFEFLKTTQSPTDEGLKRFTLKKIADLAGVPVESVLPGVEFPDELGIEEM